MGSGFIDSAEEDHRRTLHVTPRHLGHQTTDDLLSLQPKIVEDCLTQRIVLLVEHAYRGIGDYFVGASGVLGFEVSNESNPPQSRQVKILLIKL